MSDGSFVRAAEEKVNSSAHSFPLVNCPDAAYGVGLADPDSPVFPCPVSPGKSVYGVDLSGIEDPSPPFASK